jgi:ABC-type microcin C transport system duplicated ATPase subunit YejF
MKFVAAVVRQGEIVEQGTHADLILKPNGAYATLVRLQASAQHQAADDKQSLSERKLQISAEDPGVLQDLITAEVLLANCHVCKVSSEAGI